MQKMHKWTAVRLVSACIAASIGFIWPQAAAYDHRDPVSSAQLSVSENTGNMLMTPELTDAVRGLVLLLVPESIEDVDGWGKERRVQSGLNIELNDGRLETSRRHRFVNHGSWVRYRVRLENPAETFRIHIRLRQPGDTARSCYDVSIQARVHVIGQQQQWNLGVMLWSLTAEADVDVSLNTVLELSREIVHSESGWGLRLKPQIQTAFLEIERFRLQRISRGKGSLVHEAGEWLKPLIEQRVDRENKEIADRLNRSFAKNPERFVVPLTPFP
jgi:hypothetical protein